MLHIVLLRTQHCCCLLLLLLLPLRASQTQVLRLRQQQHGDISAVFAHLQV